MNKVKVITAQKKAQQGFSLVELIVVIVVLGVLAIVVAPKKSGTRGFTEFGLQKRLVASLRNTQLKAMYDTRTNYCYKVNLVTGNGTNVGFGPSTVNYATATHFASCTNSIDYNSPAYLRSNRYEIVDENIAYTAQDDTTAISYIAFDNMGRAFSSAGNCSAGCTVTLSGENDTKVCVENQGYVHVCD